MQNNIDFLALTKSDPEKAKEVFIQTVSTCKSKNDACAILGLNIRTFYRFQFRYIGRKRVYAGRTCNPEKTKDELFEPREGESPFLVALKAQCAALFAKGYTKGEIAKHFGVSRETLYNALEGQWSSKLGRTVYGTAEAE